MSEDIHAAAAQCVTRGRLMSPTRALKDYELSHLAEDLALISGSETHLARVVALLTGLPRPTVISDRPTRRIASQHNDDDPGAPHQLLARDNGARRVKALTKVAANPAAPPTTLTETLGGLHPAELAWIIHNRDAPAWWKEAAAAAVPDDDTGVIRVLTDDELDQHPEPHAVMKSWLPLARALDSPWRDHDVYEAVLESRHCTDDLIRQLPAQHVLAYRKQPAPAVQRILINACGSTEAAWYTLIDALAEHFDERSFGELLDAIAQAPAALRD